MNSLKRTEVEQILKHYNIGTLQHFKKLQRHTGAQPIYKVSTKTGNYFLKQYRKFDYFIKAGLSITDFLAEKKYPA